MEEITVYKFGEEDSVEAIRVFQTSIQPSRKPAILRGLSLGSCSKKWKNIEYLCDNVRDKMVKVHVTKNGEMDFKAKNFKYETVRFEELIRRAHCNEGDELFYLRAIGDDPRGKNAVNFRLDYPSISEDFSPPQLFDPDRFFSSVLRVSSPGVQVWTHYDVMDNIYCQVVGHKRALLWAPNEALNLYLVGDKSQVTDVDNPDLALFPKFARAKSHVGSLQPGDILFIPAMWFHNMKAQEFGIAVNTFWYNLDSSLYDKKDPYGNRDLLPAAKANRMLDNVLKQIEELPEDIKDFYARLLIHKIENKCLIKKIA